MSNTVPSRIRSSFGVYVIVALVCAFFAVLLLYGNTVANALTPAQPSSNQTDQPLGQTYSTVTVPTSVPSAWVVNVTSPVLDTPGKLQVELINPSPAKVKGKFYKVKSFAKRGHKTRIILPAGTKYPLQVQDRNQIVHTVNRSLGKKENRRFYKGSDGMWRKVSTNSLAFAGVAEFQSSQYTLYTSFYPAQFAVQVAYKVVTDLPGAQGQDDCNTTLTTPGHGEATEITPPLSVTSKYAGDAKSLAVQQLSQQFKDEVTQKSVADAKSHQEHYTTLKACLGSSVDFPTLLEVSLTNGKGPIKVYLGKTITLYATVQNVDGHQVLFDMDPPDVGRLGAIQASSVGYDNQPCPSGYSCYKVEYTAPDYVTYDYVTAYASTEDLQYAGGQTISIQTVDDMDGFKP